MSPSPLCCSMILTQAGGFAEFSHVSSSKLLFQTSEGWLPECLPGVVAKKFIFPCFVLLLLLLLLLLSLSPLYRVFTRTSPTQTTSLRDTLLQLLFRFIVNTVSGAYLPCSYVGSDGLLRQHFPENVCSA